MSMLHSLTTIPSAASRNLSNFTAESGAKTSARLVPQGPVPDHSIQGEESEVLHCVLFNRQVLKLHAEHQLVFGFA